MLLTPQTASTPALFSTGKAQRPAPLPPGTVVTHYKIDALLAQGEFGFVYRATDTLLLRQVAIKEYFPQALCTRTEDLRVAPSFAADAPALTAGREAFMQEARLLARLHHPGLVPVLDAFDAHDTAYRVMPYLEGHTLAQVVGERSGPPSARWVLDLLAQLLEPLEMLHSAGLVHGHLHPTQVMALDNGRAVLLGFGAVRRSLNVPPDAAYTHPDQVFPPGQAPRGSWTDLYALGALGWFAVTGRAPKPASERGIDGTVWDPVTELARAFGEQRVASPAQVAVMSTLGRALSPQPMQRLKTVSDFREALGVVPASAEHSSSPASPGSVATNMSGGPKTLPASSEEIDPAARELIARLVESIPDTRAHWAPPPVPSAEEQAWAQQVAMGKKPPRHLGAADGSARFGFARVVTALALLLVVGGGIAAWRWDDVRAGADRVAELMRADRTRATSLEQTVPDVVRQASPPAVLATTTPAEQQPAQAQQDTAIEADETALAPLGPLPAPTAQPPQQTVGTTPLPQSSGQASAAPAQQQQVPPGPPSVNEAMLPPTGAGPAQGQSAQRHMPSAPAQPTDLPQQRGPGPGLDSAPNMALPTTQQAQNQPQPQQVQRRVPTSPREICAGRTNFSLYYCVEQQCRRSQFQDHGQCEALRRTGEVE